MNQHHCDNKGFIALLSVLIVTAVAVSITVALLIMGVGSSRTSFARQQSTQARALADACAEEALQEIHDSVSYEGSDTLTLGQGTCDYRVTKLTGQNRTIDATGTVGTIIRKVNVVIDSITPDINILSWQEVSDF